MNKLKRFLIVIIILLGGFAIYVQIVNRNSINMTYRQKLLKAVYPAFMRIAKLTGANAKELANADKTPTVPFYSLKDTLNDGSIFDFAQLKGKKVVLVNTASDCGYTDQYGDLQKLYEANKERLIIIGFPANDFKEQEKGDDASIATFCQRNYGVSFLLMKKSSVVKGAEQNPVFQWLTEATKNGWNNKAPAWNFSKYIVNENGVLTNYFGSTISPLSDTFKNAIGK
ncbi:MAG: glutathione peroxidase [Ferruginibacter sp.]